MHERLYGELASWWPVLTPPEDREDAAAACLVLAASALPRPPRSLLELGAGVGPMATHWPQELEIVLLDRSADMSAVSRELNPTREHVVADLCEARLERRFDVVVLHDAVMYLTTPEQLQAAMHTAAMHLEAGGVLLVVPDEVEETWEPTTSVGGGERDGREARLMEWHWDPMPGDGRVMVELSLLLRETDGTVHAVHDRHEMGVFSRAAIWAAIRQAGLVPVEADPWLAAQLGEVFLARRP